MTTPREALESAYRATYTGKAADRCHAVGLLPHVVGDYLAATSERPASWNKPDVSDRREWWPAIAAWGAVVVVVAMILGWWPA